MIETIYLARHGFRLSWESSNWTSATGTPRDPPLSAHGVDQAKELAAWLAALPEAERPNVIMSSPLYRCLQTATPAADALDLPILVEFGLAEWYLPVRRGLHPRSLPPTELKSFFPRISVEAHYSVLYVTQKGETADQVHDRAEQVLRLLLRKLDQLDGVRNVVLFSHAATGIAMSRALGGDRQEHERDGLGSWTRSLNGDTSFLKRGEERHWDFSHIEAYEEDGILEDGTELPTESDKYKSIPPSPNKL